MIKQQSTPEDDPASNPNKMNETDSPVGVRPARRLRRPNDIASLALIKESTRRAYHVVYKDIFDSGVVDRRTKELIAIGAAAISGCEGCLIGHIRKAKALGLSMDEVKEAVAVAFSVNAATVVDHSDVVAAILGLDEKKSE